MRPVYRRRRDALLAALALRLPTLRPDGVSAGMHAVAWLPSELDEAAVIDAARGLGLRVHGVAPYRVSHPGDPGLIFGFATLSEATIDEGIDLLARAIDEL
jgi:GntR family transcriptional regulator/MocR family aminotransferase